MFTLGFGRPKYIKKFEKRHPDWKQSFEHEHHARAFRIGSQSLIWLVAVTSPFVNGLSAIFVIPMLWFKRRHLNKLVDKVSAEYGIKPTKSGDVRVPTNDEKLLGPSLEPELENNRTPLSYSGFEAESPRAPQCAPDQLGAPRVSSERVLNSNDTIGIA